MIATRIVNTLLLILLSALLSSCGWASSPPTPMPRATPAPAAQPVIPVIPAAVTPPTPAPPATPLPAIYAAPIPHASYIDRSHEGKAIASVQERIYLADVVVRARLQSASNGVLRFRSVSYLKGTGPKTFTVRGETDGRPTQWDNRDAILFLDELAGETEDFEFTDTTTGWTYVWNYSDHYTGSLRAGYTLGTRNPVWLPLEDSRTSRARSPNGAPHVADHDALGNTVSVAQSEIEQTIRWTSGPSGESAAGGRARSVTEGTNSTSTATLHDYGVCLDGAMEYYRKKQDYELKFNGPRPILLHEMPLESGQRGGTALVDSHRFLDGYGYPEIWVEGPDADLFGTQIVDDDKNPLNGYDEKVLTTRPLPMGTYRIDFWGYPFEFAFCNFRPEDYYSMIDVNVEAPEGTLHEAFFDPATTTAGVGYLAGSATTTGVLEPAGMSVGGRAITITGLTWQDGRVVLSLDRVAQIPESLSFIEPDGTAGLYLSQYDATEDWAARTMTWQVSDQPWEPGDELMLRISPIPLPGVRNLTAETDSAGQAVLSWEVDYTAGVSGYRIWRHQPGRDAEPMVYVQDTLSTDTTYTDTDNSLGHVTEYSVQAIGRGSTAGEKSEPVRIGGQ